MSRSWNRTSHVVVGAATALAVRTAGAADVAALGDPAVSLQRHRKDGRTAGGVK
ncbi:hypothetical protein [Streptomyces hypolithicus]